MAANPALSVLITLLVSLFPIAVYCLTLSSINRRAEPLLVRGVTDFAGVLFAASGMVLWTVPAMLVAWHERSFAAESTRSFEQLLNQWWAIWAGYFALVVGGSVFLLWLRTPTSAIYNVQSDLVPHLLAATLQRLGYDFAQNAQHQFLIAPAKTLTSTAITTPDVASTSGQFASTPDAAAPYSAAIEIQPLASMCHATLHWYDTEPAVRLEIEEELRKQLAGARPVENSAAIWQLSVGILLFGAIFLSVLFFILAAFYPRH
jgi:hypothetical protein